MDKKQQQQTNKQQQSDTCLACSNIQNTVCTVGAGNVNEGTIQPFQRKSCSSTDRRDQSKKLKLEFCLKIHPTGRQAMAMIT